MAHTEIAVNAWAEFEIDRFTIEAGLRAAKHHFIFNGKKATVSLPIEEDKPDVPFEMRRLILRSWREGEGGSKVPLIYKVQSLTLDLELPGTIRIPDAARQLPPKRPELFSSQEQQQLDRTVAEEGEDLRAAFSHWLRTLRWKSGIGDIGEPRIDYGGDRQSTTLVERGTGHRFWTQTARIVLQAQHAINLAEWQFAQSALTDLKAPPAWFDFVFDSQMRLNNQDLVGAVLSLAIALETNIRFIFFGELRSATVDPVLVEVFDLTNLRSLLSRLKKVKHWNADWAAAADISAFNRLMDLRNNVMHLAKTDSLNKAELRKLHGAVKTFAYFTSKTLGLE